MKLRRVGLSASFDRLVKTYPIPCSTTARRLSCERTTRLLKRNASSNVHSLTVSCSGDDEMRIKEMVVLSPKCNEKRFRSLTQSDLNATAWLSRGHSYRTDDSASFHPSVYSRSRTRRWARLHTVSGLSTKPALKRSIRCCRYWDLETRSKKRRLTCEGQNVNR